MLRELALKEDQSTDLTPLAKLGQVANAIASGSVFQDYRQRKSKNTIRRQDAGLALFKKYLESKGAQVGDLAGDPQAWTDITWGLVAGFLRWQLAQGYAVSTVNVRLSTIKTYAKLAFKVKALNEKEYALIQTVEGYSRKEAIHVDELRKEANIDDRRGYKKAMPMAISPPKARKLKDQPDTPQGRRDRLLLCLLLDHGLRVGEVAQLTVGDFDLSAGELTFYRSKVDKTQTHRLSRATQEAAQAYLSQDAPAIGPLLRGSVKGGDLVGVMSDRAITKRVRYLGQKLGIDGLSAHDCRHYWATQAARHNTPIERLQDAGGWNSLAMPARYIEAAKIANEGVQLGD